MSFQDNTLRLHPPLHLGGAMKEENSLAMRSERRKWLHCVALHVTQFRVENGNVS